MMIFIIMWLLLLWSDINESGESNDVILDFVGDISFDGAVKYYHNKGICPYNNTFANMVSVFKQSDLVIGNLESAVVDDDMKKDAQLDFSPLLSAEPESIEALKYAGFNIVTLANNHLNDYKTKPINYTVDLLRKHGILSFGYTFGQINEHLPQNPLTVENKGIRIGFLGYCSTFRIRRLLSKGQGPFQHCIKKRGNLDAGPAIYTDQAATRDVNRLKDKVDVIVVVMHWGEEYHTSPTKLQQRQAAHLKSIGVQVVIGHHPHVLQGHVIDDRFLVSYSVGNFVFGPSLKKNKMFYYGKQPSKKAVKKFEEYMKSSAAMENNSQLKSRLIRIRLNKQGDIAAAYLPLQIRLNPNTKCLQPTPRDNATWITVCSSRDKACL